MSIGPNNWQPIYLFFFFLAEILECWAPAPKEAVLMSFAGSPLFCADKMSAVFSLYHLPGVLFFHLKIKCLPSLYFCHTACLSSLALVLNSGG